MTAHVNEFNPTATRAIYGVQTDAQKLKFNNIRSCIAVGLVANNLANMIGVHFTTSSTSSDVELEIAMGRIKTTIGNGKCDAYLVANYDFHSHTKLLQKLKKICKNIYLCDIPPMPNGEADVDVKMEKNANGIKTYIRPHALFLLDINGKRILKNQYATTADIPKSHLQTGKSAYQSDKDSKPWMLATFKKIA